MALSQCPDWTGRTAIDRQTPGHTDPGGVAFSSAPAGPEDRRPALTGYAHLAAATAVTA